MPYKRVFDLENDQAFQTTPTTDAQCPSATNNAVTQTSKVCVVLPTKLKYAVNKKLMLTSPQPGTCEFYSEWNQADLCPVY